jgi:hypothetical protein
MNNSLQEKHLSVKRISINSKSVHTGQLPEWLYSKKHPKKTMSLFNSCQPSAKMDEMSKNDEKFEQD